MCFALIFLSPILQPKETNPSSLAALEGLKPWTATLPGGGGEGNG